MVGEIQKNDLAGNAELLQHTVMGLVSGRIGVEEARKSESQARQGVAEFIVQQGDITGTFCPGSTAWDWDSRSGFKALEVLAETDDGPREMRLSLLRSGEADFQIIGARAVRSFIAV